MAATKLQQSRLRDAVADYVLGPSTLVLFACGLWWGLKVAPPERMMGDVYRIMFVHVPSAWLAFVAYFVTFLASVAYLWRGGAKMDAVAEASAELGVLFNVILLVTGSVWGRPTWGVWWTWDPRLTTAAIMLFAFAGYLALRRLVDDDGRRANWAAVVAVLISADLPIVWFSVKWWNSLHQLQSSPATVAAPMVVALRLNAFAFLAFYLWCMHHRYRLALARQRPLQPPPLAAADGRGGQLAGGSEDGPVGTHGAHGAPKDAVKAGVSS